MLVLQRKSGEALLINGNIFIKISEINGDKVKIAIDAPRSVEVMRLELAEAAKINNESASATLEALNTLKLTAVKAPAPLPQIEENHNKPNRHGKASEQQHRKKRNEPSGKKNTGK